MEKTSFKYWAFISYSHRDRKAGDWIHKKLETHKVPEQLVGRESRDGEIPDRLFPVFRDREELPTSANLGEQITTALEQSRYLVVICSPNSAKSRWVNEEILTFRRLGRSDRILALIIDGEPNATDIPQSTEPECFPPALRFELGPDQEIAEDCPAEPIAADARTGKDGKENALLKLIAGLIGVGFDDLKQREQERRMRRLRIQFSFVSVLAGLFIALALAFFSQKNEARTQRDVARETLGRSDYLLALDRLESDSVDLALAHLARAIRTAQHVPSSERAALLLQQRSWFRPVAPAIERTTGIKRAVFGPDGESVAILGYDDSFEVVDIETGVSRFDPVRLGIETVSMPKEFGGNSLERRQSVFDLKFTSDGNNLVVVFGVLADQEGDAFIQTSHFRIWDARTGEPKCADFASDRAFRLALNTEGSIAATGGPGGIEIRGLPEGDLITELPDIPAYGIRLSRDGKYLLALGSGGFHFISVVNGEVLRRVNGDFSSMGISTDGTEFSVADENSIRTYSAPDWLETKSRNSSLLSPQILYHPGDDPTILAWAQKWRGDAIIERWFERADPIVVARIEEGISDIQFSPSGEALLTSLGDGEVSFVDPHSLTGFSDEPSRQIEPIPLIRGRQAFDTNLEGLETIHEVDLAKSGDRLATVGIDGVARFYANDFHHASSYQGGSSMLPEIPGAVGRHLATSPGGGDAVVYLYPKEDAGTVGGLRIVSVPGGEFLSDLLPTGGVVDHAAYSEDGEVIALLSGRQVRLWDLSNGESSTSLAVASEEAEYYATSCAINQTTGVVVVPDQDNNVIVWDYREDQVIRRIPVKEYISCLALDRSGRYLALSVTNEMDEVFFFEVWDLVTGVRKTGRLGLGERDPIDELAFSSDGDRLLVRGFTGVRVWDWGAGRQLSDVFSLKENEYAGPGIMVEPDSSGFSIGGTTWDLSPPGAAPVWFADLLESIGGIELTEDGLPTALVDPYSRYEKVRREIESLSDSPWKQLGSWFLSLPEQRGPSFRENDSVE